MIPFTEGYVPANHIKIHYQRAIPPKPGAPTIVFLHGITDNGPCWVRVAEALQEDYDLVLMDARGHGLSDAPEQGYGAEDRAADTAGLIEALDLQQPFLFGHSMGSETAIATAAIYPQLVRGVVLEDPPWPGRTWGSTYEDREERAAQWRADIAQYETASREELITRARQSNPTWPEEEFGPWADAKKQVSPNIANIVHAPRRRWSDYVRQAQCPILLITADPERGAIVTEETAQEAALFWKQGQTVHIPEAGHCIHREQFAPVMQAVRAFLDQVLAAGTPTQNA